MMIPKEMKFRHQSLVTKASLRKQNAAVVQGQKRKGRQRFVNTLLERKKIMIEPCNYCGKKMACVTKSGTTSLKKHVNIACKAYEAWRSVNKDNNQGALDVDDGNIRVCKVSESVFREATNEMMVVGELALSWVESVAWRNFCNRTKLYVPHSRRTAT